MPAQYELISAARLTGIMQGLQDPRTLPQELLWSRRIPDVPALDGEILARFVGQVLVADLVADDSRAVVYSQGRFQFETTKVPNLKLGIAMNQEMLNQLDRIRQQMATAQDQGIFKDYINRTVDALRLGVQQRKEALHVAMLLDGLSYNRLGIIIDNATWGMPTDLKVTPATPWTTAGSATPITDIQTIRRIARVRYGIEFNRVTMSTAAFQYMCATTEFLNQAKLFFGGSLLGIAPGIPSQSDQTMRALATRVLDGMEIELYDARYFYQEVSSGAVQSAPYLPINKVILTSSQNDGNRMAYDFANGVVTESIVASLGPVNIIGGGDLSAQYGPITYATAPQDLNPPTVTFWGVARGFPRKHMLQSSAVLTVGTFTDTISTAVPFSGT